MAQFRAVIRGQRGEASRLGSKNSGIDARINGWTSGVRVAARHEDGVDVFDVFATAGSGYGPDRLIATVTNAETVLHADKVTA